jgi:hypothetical protein
MSAYYLLRRKGIGNPIIIGQVSGVAFFLLILVILWAIPVYAANQPGSRQLTEPEKWVLSQVKEGREADLERKFGAKPGMHRLGAAFLEKLILGGFSPYRIPRQGIQIAHASIDGLLNLEYIEVDYPLSLSRCLFQNPVSCQESHFRKDLTLSGSRFLQAANFKDIKVDGNVFCNDTIFEEESLWSDAKIGEKFHAIGARFLSHEAKADFSAMKVGTNAFLTSATFYGPVDFGLVHIGRQFNINKAEFFNERETVNFISTKVEQIAYFKQVRFHGPVDFAIAQIGLQFNADEAEFLCPDKMANFSGIKIGNTIYFQRARFHGPLKFEFAEIGVNFRGTGAAFLNESQTKNFSRMKVNQKVFLDKTAMAGNVDMSYSNFTDLEIQGLRNDEKGPPEPRVNLPLLNLKGALIQRELKVINARIGELNASDLQVKGPALFDNVEITTSADFRNSAFQTLAFQGVTFPEIDKKTASRKVYLSELTYNYIGIDKQDNADYNPIDYQKIRNLVETSPFNTQTYVQLEAFFKRIGRDKWANEVFIRMHDRDLAENLPWWSLRRWLEWFFWGVLAGYGRAPFRVFFVSLSLIALGALLFDPGHLKVGKPEDSKVYKSMVIRFLLSLDRFLPIDLGLSKYWDSKACHFFIWLFFHLELILGWILIPIALASIYSQIK